MKIYLEETEPSEGAGEQFNIGKKNTKLKIIFFAVVIFTEKHYYLSLKKSYFYKKYLI